MSLRDLIKPSAAQPQPIAVKEDIRHLGPAMQECDVRERAFVEARMAGNNLAESARIAGYGTPTTKPQTFASIGNRIINRPHVQEALMELTRKAVRAFGADAVKALGEIVNDRHHPQRLKGVETVLNRIDPTVTRVDQNVKVEVIDHTQETLKHLAHLLDIGVDHAALVKEFGEFGLERYMRLLNQQRAAEAKTIDGEVNEETHD